MSERVVWGLDIGQNGIRAVKLERGKGASTKLLDYFFLAIESQPDDPQHGDKVREALLEFAEEKKPGPVPVVLSLPGYTTLFRSFPLPEVSPGKLREVVSYEAKQLIPYPLEEVQWDFQQLGYNEETGEIQIALLCCRRDIIDNLLEMADEAGLIVEDVQVSPVALVNYCLYDNPPEGTAMLLDCGARSTDFVMFDEEMFWLRSIAICGDDVSRTLMNKFSISFDEAQQLKSSMADAKQAARVFKVVEPVMRSLASEAQRSFGFYRSTRRGARVDELILAGNTFLMEGADQYMADSLGYGARTMDIPASVSFGPGVDPQQVMENRQVYGIAAGLALQGLGLSKFRCSLLPEARRMRKLIKGKEKFGWAVAGVIAVTVLLGLATTKSMKPVFDRSLARVNEVTAQASQRQNEYDEKMKQFEPAQKRNRAMLDIGKGRGWLTRAADLVRKQIENLNNARQSKINPQRISALPQQKIIENLRANILALPASRRMYEDLLKEKTAEYKINEQTDEETRSDMTQNLQMQVLRRVATIHNRQKRTFITSEAYRIVKATRHEENAEVIWQVDGLVQGDKGQPGGAQPMQPGEFPPPGMMPENIPLAVDDPGKINVVLVRVDGFTVTQDGEDMRELRESLLGLKALGLYLYDRPNDPGFKLLRDRDTDTNNTINLPVIYDPTPKKANLDDLGEGSAIDRTEKLKYEAFTQEKIIRFEAVLIYQPPVTEVAAETLEAVVLKAVDRSQKQEEQPAEVPAPAAGGAEDAPAAPEAPAAPAPAEAEGAAAPVAVPAPAAAAEAGVPAAAE